MTTTLASAGDVFSGLGGILTGITEILGLVGAGIGFLVRSRRNARRERLRTETAATIAATEAKKQLEARLDRQHKDLIEQYKNQLEDMEKSYERTLAQSQEQIRALIAERDAWLARYLEFQKEPNKNG